MHTISRDHSPAANQALAGPVPKELMDYLQQHKDTLIPEFRQVWAANGFKTSGTWEEVFGTGAGTEGIFMAWNYARYIGRVVEAGKAEYPLPMFVNAAMYAVVKDQFTPSHGRPWDLVMDIWRAGGRKLTFSRPTFTAWATSRRFAQSTPNRATRCSSPRRAAGRDAPPGRSMLSDATTPSASRRLALTGWVQRFRARRRLWSPLATGAPDSGTPGQRHHVRRHDAHERPASKGQGGELHAARSRLRDREARLRTTATAARPRPRWRCSSRRGLTSTSWWATA